MYVMWNNIVVPLLLILLILFILCIIFAIFSVLETMIFTKSSEFKLRREIRKTIKNNCKILEDDINNMFNYMIDSCTVNEEEISEKIEEDDN